MNSTFFLHADPASTLDAHAQDSGVPVLDLTIGTTRLHLFGPGPLEGLDDAMLFADRLADAAAQFSELTRQWVNSQRESAPAA